ncbi:MAG: SufE family protein [Planctomycetes bacterium]|nr:SufE family protein [Planctomycetota bacterium]
MTIQEILDVFQELEDWDERCDYLIDLGFELPKLPESVKIEANRVHGCQSNVWMLLRFNEGVYPVVEIEADSDSLIVRGLIAVLLAVYSGRTAAEIAATDVRDIFSQLELDRQLSQMRRNGLNGMVKRIRGFAAAQLEV